MNRQLVAGLLLAVLAGGSAVGDAGGPADSFLRLHSTTEEGVFSCVAVATNIGVLTALHCVEGAQQITLFDRSGGEWPAAVVGTSRQIAILTSELWANPILLAPVISGDPVAAWTGKGWMVARAFSYPPESSMPAVVSANFRAAPGDSGAPVIDAKGRLVALVNGGSHFGNTVLEPVPFGRRATIEDRTSLVGLVEMQ